MCLPLAVSGTSVSSEGVGAGTSAGEGVGVASWGEGAGAVVGARMGAGAE